MSIHSRFALAFAVLCILPTLVLGAGGRPNAEHSLTANALEHLESVAALQHGRVGSLADRNRANRDRERVAPLGSRTQLRMSLARYLDTAAPEAQARTTHILDDAKSALPAFAGISVADPEGNVVAATGSLGAGGTIAGEPYFLRARDEGFAFHVQRAADGRIEVFLGTDLRLIGRRVGAGIVGTDSRDLERIAGSHTRLGATGETLLARREGAGSALFLTPTRFDDGAALQRTATLDARGLPMRIALEHQERALDEATDHRGVPVLAATRFDPGPDWRNRSTSVAFWRR